VWGKMRRRPIFFEIFKDSYGKFQLGTRQKGEYSKVNRLPITVTSGSQIIEFKSKIPIYIKFAGHGINTVPQYCAIIEELEKKGYKVDTVEDIIKLNDLASGINIDGIDQDMSKEEREELSIMLDKLKEDTISISTQKTYKITDLKNHFIYNMNADFMEGIKEEEINISLKNAKVKDNIVKFSLLALAIVGGLVILLVIFFSVVKIPKSEQVVCNCGKVGVDYASAIIQNITM
jgi:hypothetical protein